jgi:hypothetical protein
MVRIVIQPEEKEKIIVFSCSQIGPHHLQPSTQVPLPRAVNTQRFFYTPWVSSLDAVQFGLILCMVTTFIWICICLEAILW